MATVLRQLQREVFVLTPQDRLDMTPTLDGFESLLRDDGDLEVAIHAEQDLNQLFAVLNSQNINVLSLRNKSNRLEELFIGMVEQKQVAESSGGA